MLDRLPARLLLVHMVSRVAALRGVDHRPLLAAVGLDGEDPGWDGRVVARARLSALLTLLARRACDEALGLELAAAADPHALGPSGAALGLGRTLGEGLAAHIRQMPSLQGGLDYALVGEGPRMRLVHRHRGGTPEESRVMNEGVAAFILRALRGMAGDDNLPVHVVFPHRPRVPARIYEDRLRAAVTFRPGDGISVSFDAAHLALPNRAGPGALPARGSALSARDAEMDDAALVAALSRTFAPAAAARRLYLRHVAAMLGHAPRSLQRRLAAIGMAFEDRVDGWRRDEARRMLADTAMPVGDVAALLGYADASHFIRAFQRWEGVSPALWRRARV